jgi:hypothetical protein
MSCSRHNEPTKMQEVLALQNMSELATAEYVVTKIIKANDNNTWYKPGDRKILMTCKASLVAGIDLSKLTADEIKINGDEISISLPRAHLLYINIKPEDIKTVYQQVSLFRDQFTSEEKNQLAAQAQKQITSAVDSIGIINSAETNATIFINSFLQKLGYKTIRVNFSNHSNSLQ